MSGKNCKILDFKYGLESKKNYDYVWEDSNKYNFLEGFFLSCSLRDFISLKIKKIHLIKITPAPVTKNPYSNQQKFSTPSSKFIYLHLREQSMKIIPLISHI